MPLETFVTLDQVAERLGISRRKVNYLVARGHLKVLRLGHCTVRVKESDVNKLVERWTD